MDIEQVSTEKLFWLTIIHLTFVVSTLLVALIDRLTPPKTAANKS